MNYTYKGINPNVDVTVKAADRRVKDILTTTVKIAAVPIPAQVTKEKPVVVKAPAKKPKVVVSHIDEDEDDVPVMDRGRKSSKRVDDVEATFGSSGSIGSYSVDADWDQVDELNIKHLI